MRKELFHDDTAASLVEITAQIIDGVIGRRPERGPDAAALEYLSSARMQCAEEVLSRESLWETPLGDLFPGLDAVPGLGPSGVSARVRNALARHSDGSWDAVASLTLRQVSLWRGVGIGAMRDLLASVLGDWADACILNWIDLESLANPSGRSTSEVGETAHRTNEPPPDVPDHFAPLAEGVLDALRWLWSDCGARTLREAIHLWVTSAPPSALRATVDTALDLDLGPLIGAKEPSEDAWLALLDFDDRALSILAHRRFWEPVLTLEELGRRFGVTRERIRQIEVRSLEDLTRRWDDDVRCAPLRHLAAMTRRAIGSIATIDDLASALSKAARDSSDAQSSASELALREGVLRSFLGPREEVAGMSLTEAAADTLRASRAMIDQMDTGALVSQDWFAERVAELGADCRFRPWIQEQLRLRELDEGYVPWRGSLNEKTVAIMTVRNRTMTMMELHEAIGLDVDPRYLRNVLHGDDRIVRRGLGRYGLRAWGGEEYSGIVEELHQAILRSPNGEVVLSEIIARFVEDFGVSEGSVRSYAGDWRFMRGPNGTLRLRGAGDPDPTYRHQAPEDTPGLFLIEGTWHLRVVVNLELLRGSGRVTRNGVAILAGLEPEMMVGFEYEGGAVTFSWRAKQPAIGSLRGIAVAHACVEGDRLFVPLEGPEPRRSRVARVADMARASDLERLALEMGLPGGDEADDLDPGPIARTLALPRGADWHDVVDRLRDRGEDFLEELIPLHWR